MNTPARILAVRLCHSDLFKTLCGLLAMAMLASQSARAATFYWDTDGATAGSGAATGTWNSAGSTTWSTDSTGSTAVGTVTTANTDDLFIAAGTNGTTGTITVSGAVLANSITFDDPVDVTISGGTSITLGGGGGTGTGIFQTANGANVISTGVILGASSTAFSFSNASTSLLTIGAVTGAATSGTQTITVGSSSSGGITLNGIIGNGAGGGNVALTINNTSTGVTTLSGANTYSGGTTISGGIVSINAANRLGTGTTLLNGGTLRSTSGSNTDFNTATAITIGASGGTINQVQSAGTFRFQTANSLLGSGTLTITGNGTLTSAGSTVNGVVVLNTSNTYSGNVIVQDGGLLEYNNASGLAGAATVTVGNQGGLSASNTTVANAVTVNSGGTLLFQNGNGGVFSGAITLNANTTIRMQDWYAGTVRNGTISGQITGAGGLTVNSGTGSGGVLTLSGTNDYAGGTTINSSTAQFTKLVAMAASGAVTVNTGSTLAVNLGGTGEWTTGTSGNGTVGGLLAGLGGQSGGTVSWAGTVTLSLDTANAGSTQTYSGNIANVGTSLGLTKLGNGTLVLSGANTYTGATTVNAGTVTLSGSLGATGTAAGVVNVGQAGNSSNAILNVQTGSTLKLNNANMLVGNGTMTAGQGFVFQSGGAVSGINQLTIGVGTNSYGYYNLSGGTLGMNELDVGGFNAGSAGVVDMSGGTMNVANWLILGRGGNGNSGVLNMTGGTLNYSGGNAFQVNWGQGTTGNQRSVVNIANASLISANNKNVNLMSSGVSTNLGEINLLSGGLLQANGIAPGSATGTSLLNFNGGTLKAFSANATFLTTNLTAVNVYSGGGTIDNNGVNITLLKGLLAPAGSGANSNPTVTNGGSGYVGAPLVTVTGASGVGAAAYATVSGGVVTGIVVTNPGAGYTGPLSFTLTGGGGTGAVIANVAQTANTSGGMTFQGSGTTTLTAASTYTGNTSISMGKTTGLNSASKLNLSFAANQIDIINNTSNSSALILGGSLASNATTVLGGGQLTLTGVATSVNTQRFNGMTVGTGGNNIVFANNVTANTIALDVGAISRTVGGTLHVTQPTDTVSTANGVQTSTGTASTILTDANGTAYATVGATAAGAGDWAAKDATNAFIVGGSTIGGFYVDANDAATFTTVGATGNANITGGFTATAGTNVGSLRMNGAFNLNLNGGTTTIGTGGVLFGSGTNQTISNGTIRAGTGMELVFINTNTSTPQINAVITDSTSGASSVTYRALQLTSGNGQFAIGGAGNTYTGNTYIESGRVATNVSTAFGTGAGANVYINGNTNGQAYLTGGTFANHFYLVGNGWNETSGPFGVLRLQGATVSGQVTLLGNATISDQGGTGTISGVIDDGGNAYALTVNGSGTLILTNANTYTGATTISAGTLRLGNAGTTGSLVSTGTISIATNATLAFNRTNPVTQGTDFGTLTSTTGILTQLGTGALTLTGSNSIQTLNVNNATGTVDIGAGSLTLSNGGGSTIQSSTGGTINGTGGGMIVLGSNLGDVGTANGTTLTINAAITGIAANNFEVYGGATGGTVVLTNNANTFAGNVTIDGGTLSVSNIGNTGSTTSQLGAGTTIFMNNGGAAQQSVLKYTGTGETTNRIISLSGTTGGATIDQSGASGNLLFTANFATPGAGAKTLILQGSTAGTGEISGAIIDNSGTNKTSLTKAGTGTWTLSGANTYTGATTVSAGTLLANNTANSATGSGNVTVLTGARLGGNGVVGLITGTQNITVNSGGLLGIGNTGDIVGDDLDLMTSGVGVITFNGTLEFDIYDNLGGTANLTNPLATNDLLNLTSDTSIVLSGTLKVTDTTGLSDTTWAAGDTWQLFDWTNVSPLLNNSGTFTTLDLPMLNPGLEWNSTELYTLGTISVAVVPEPSRAVLMLAAFMALVLRRRRSLSA